MLRYVWLTVQNNSIYLSLLIPFIQKTLQYTFFHDAKGISHVLSVICLEWGLTVTQCTEIADCQLLPSYAHDRLHLQARIKRHDLVAQDLCYSCPSGG